MMIQQCNVHRQDAEDAERAQSFYSYLHGLCAFGAGAVKRGVEVSSVALLSTLCLILITFQAEAQSQPQSQGDSILRAPKDSLIDVHLPDLEKLEPGVREHILSAQNSLIDLCKTPATTDEKLSESYGLMGQIYQAYTLTAPAEECYLNAHRLSPKDFRWVYLLGNVYQQKNQSEEAIDYYKRARNLRSDYTALWVNLGNLYLQQNRLEEARNSFNVAVSIDAKSAAALYGFGQVALSERSYAEAVDYLEKALALVPDANRIHYSLAMSYRGLGNMGKAQEHLARQGAVGIRVPDPLVDNLQQLTEGERVHLVRGRAAFEARRFSDATEEFRKAVAAKPDSVAARVNLGSALAQTGEIDEAVEQFKEALGIDPRNQAANYNLGFLLAKQNQPDQAISHLRIVVDANPKDSEARRLLAQQLLKAGRTEEALTEMSRLVEMNPDDEDALLDQVNLLMNKKQYRQALDAVKKGHSLFPKKGRTAVTLAYLLAASPEYNLRDGARALELARLVYQSTGSISHGAIVAMAMAELGRCGEAIEWQKRMISAAEQEKKPDLVEKLKDGLRHYESANPCRPAGETPSSENRNF